MKVLVTGNKGYIGSVLCENLLKEGFDVIGLDTNFYKGCNFTFSNYKVSQIEKDIRKITKKDIGGIDAVVHLAALSNDPMGELNPSLTDGINYKSSVNLAKFAKEKGIKRFVFSSSCSIYGFAKESMVDENSELNPLTEYAKSKVKSEKNIAELADKEFSPVFLRNSTVYGISPMLRVDLVVNNLVGWAYTTGKIRIMSDGTPWRPLIHIQDICKAFIAVLKAPKELIHNQVFNVGQNKENYQIKDIGDAIKKLMPDCSIEYTGEHGQDSRSYKVNFFKINDILGDFFKPTWNIEKGVRELLTAYKRYNLTKENFEGNSFIRLKRIKKLIEEEKLDKELFWKKETQR